MSSVPVRYVKKYVMMVFDQVLRRAICHGRQWWCKSGKVNKYPRLSHSLVHHPHTGRIYCEVWRMEEVTRFYCIRTISLIHVLTCDSLFPFCHARLSSKASIYLYLYCIVNCCYNTSTVGSRRLEKSFHFISIIYIMMFRGYEALPAYIDRHIEDARKQQHIETKV